MLSDTTTRLARLKARASQQPERRCRRAEQETRILQQIQGA